MITLIEARHYRCLRYIQQPLGPFHVLVGPNASGKTTFLDVVSFLGSLVSKGLDAAIDERTKNFQDLLWMRQGTGFELAVEAEIPEERRKLLHDTSFDTVRYEVSVGIDNGAEEVVILAEQVLLKKATGNAPSQTTIFPRNAVPPDTIMTTKSGKATKKVVNKVMDGNDNYYPEVKPEDGKGWVPAFKFGPRRSALGNLPDDETKFPVATWFKKMLVDGTRQLVLNSQHIRKASPPGQGRGFKTDGSNLPWVIDALAINHADRFNDWIDHLKTALPDLETVFTVEREDDRHRYMGIRYPGQLEVKSWMASDGTLRLMALTLLAYLPDFSGVYLIEEPENGIHPRAVETIFQSLSSVYDAQILLASHSPVILSMVEPRHVLCFAKNQAGATDIVPGNRHPALKDWRGETNLGVLFAGGVLG